MFDLLVELVGWLFVELVKGMSGAVSELSKGISRAMNVWRQEQRESHTATEYADALLFGDEDRRASNSSSPASILDGQRH